MPEAYPKPYQKSKTEYFVKIVNAKKLSSH